MADINKTIEECAKEMGKKVRDEIYRALELDPFFQEFIRTNYYIENHGNNRYALRRVGLDARLVRWEEVITFHISDL